MTVIRPNRRAERDPMNGEIRNPSEDVHLTGVDEQLKRIWEIAPAGFVMALDINWGGPTYAHFEFPDEWRDRYYNNNYFILDPVFYYTMTRRGRKRWSELRLPDPARIFEKAKEYNLNFGAVFSLRHDRTRSFITTARQDREFTDAELDEIQELFEHCVRVAMEK